MAWAFGDKAGFQRSKKQLGKNMAIFLDRWNIGRHLKSTRGGVEAHRFRRLPPVAAFLWPLSN